MHASPVPSRLGKQRHCRVLCQRLPPPCPAAPRDTGPAPLPALRSGPQHGRTHCNNQFLRSQVRPPCLKVQGPVQEKPGEQTAQSSRQRFVYTQTTPDCLLVQPKPWQTWSRASARRAEKECAQSSSPGTAHLEPRKHSGTPVLAAVVSLLTGSSGANKLSHRLCHQC